MNRPLPRHLPALDGLRGVAALVVLVSHCANEGWLPKALGTGFGQIGVMLFYVLSGFLMMHFAVDQPFDRIALRRYAVARMSRVLPLYFVAVAITGVAFAIHGTSFYNVRSWQDLALNAALARGTGVLWSVPVELHFYLLFPLLWWAHRGGRFLPVCAAMLLGCGLLAVFGSQTGKAGYLPFWLHFFVIGCLVRWLLGDGAQSRLPLRMPQPWFGIAVWATFALLALTPPELRPALLQSTARPWYDPLAILLLPPVLWFGAVAAGPFRILALPALRWLGTISFGVYLLHSPVISVLLYTRIDVALGPALSFLTVLLASLSGAALAHRWIERPAQTALRRRYASPSIAAQP